MSCDIVSSYLARESGRISGDIARLGRITSPWTALTESGFFPTGMGFSISKVIYQRTIPSGGAGWTAVAAGTAQATSAACNPNPATISSRKTTQTATMSEYVVVSDPLCITELSTAYNATEQVSEIKRNFSKNVLDLWEDRNRDTYYDAVPDENKLVFSGNALVPGSGGDFDATAPDSQISQDALDYVRWKLQHDGAGEDGAYAKVDGEPIFLAIMSPEQKRALIKSDDAVRQDFRWADPALLLKPFGIKGAYAGYFHMIDLKAPRWNLVEGAWERVPFYEANGSGVAVVNPDYESAEYEDIIIYHKKVYKRLMAKPLSGYGSGANFRAWDYAGEVQWIGGKEAYDPTCNRFGDQGYWAARLRAAYQSVIPQYGYIIRVKRCSVIGDNPCPTT